jgi:NAD(P)-dependent dehydrogenase (short-subunit alcohol dehydrogenase family)
LQATVTKLQAPAARQSQFWRTFPRLEKWKKAVGQTIEEFGRLDTVFANAGINGVWAPIEELAPEEWDETIKINLRGTFLTVKYAIPHLKKQGGSIIITSSVNGTRNFSNPGCDRLLVDESRASRLYENGGARTRQTSNPRQRHLSGRDLKRKSTTTRKNATSKKPPSRSNIPKAKSRSPTATRAAPNKSRNSFYSSPPTHHRTFPARKSGLTARSRFCRVRKADRKLGELNALKQSALSIFETNAQS